MSKDYPTIIPLCLTAQPANVLQLVDHVFDLYNITIRVPTICWVAFAAIQSTTRTMRDLADNYGSGDCSRVSMRTVIARLGETIAS